MKRQTARDITVVAAAAALMIAGQVGMSYLPNIEPVSLFVILFTQHFGRKTLAAIYVFVLVEGLIYGITTWFICYLYVWTVLYFLVVFFREIKTPLGWAIVSGVFGLLFGMLCTIPYFFILGVGGGIGYFISGIPFDLLHCAGNFVIALIAWKPLDRVLTHITAQTMPQ